MCKTEEQSEAEKKERLRKFSNLTEAVNLLDDTKINAEEILLDGDGVYWTKSGNRVDQFELLRRYNKLKKVIERSYMLVHNGI